MRYFALAADYDGTLARHGAVSESTIAALNRLRSSGRKLILVTGRRLPDLLEAFANIDLFDIAVVENGAVLYRPDSKQEVVLATAPHPAFVELLRNRGVEPLAVGHVVVATIDTHKQTVLGAIEELGLELQIVFNKGAVMVLPAGVNKATGLAAALDELGLSLHNVVGVGDAENDHAFLTACECGVAVHNALGSLMEQADFVTLSDDGEGVVELIDHILDNDLADIEPKLSYRNIVLGRRASDSSEVSVPAYGVNVLVSGSNRSAIVNGFLSRLTEAKYEFVVAATPSDAQEARARTGKPHWVVIDEPQNLGEITGVMVVMADPSNIARQALARVDLVIAADPEPEKIIAEFCRAVGEEPPPIPPPELESGDVLLWSRRDGSAPMRFHFEPGPLAAPLHIQAEEWRYVREKTK